jgi:hypothetical protein
MTFVNYIGIPWEAGAQGPNSYDCMGFFRNIQKEHFGIAVPSIIATNYEDPISLAHLFGDHPERKRWTKLDAPKQGCAVIIRRPMHIGTWLDIDGGGVLHCVKGAGVIFTSDSSWPVSGFGRREFFELRQ